MSDALFTSKIEENAKRFREDVAVRCGADTLSWTDLDRRSRSLAVALAALECGPGDRVAIFASGSIAHVEVLLGILRCGASAVPLPGLATAATLSRLLSDCGAKVMFVSRDMRALAAQALQGDHRIVTGGRIGMDFSDPQWRDRTEWMESAPPDVPLPRVAPDDEFNAIYSSGTTGTPKGITHSHRIRAAQMAAAATAGFDRNAVTLISTALYANWTLFGLFASLWGGGRTVLLPSYDAREYLRLLREEGVTHAFLVPVQVTRLLAEPDFDRSVKDTETMKLCAGSPLPVSAKREVLRRWPGGLIENYGMTEGAPSTLLFAHLHPDKLESVGCAMEGGELRILDDEGRELPPGEVGEVVGRTTAMTDGYLNHPDLTAQMEWIDEAGGRFFRSGDLGRLDDDGFLYLMGRKKDLIISGGMNVYPSDIEQVLLTHPEVAEAAVIGVPSERWGETPLALVVLRAGTTTDEEQLENWANTRLGKAQRVSAVELRESLPRGALDKVLKRELRRPYWVGRGASG